MSKIGVVVGTRPEAIKLIPVFLELKQGLGDSQVVLISTGQHQQMLNQVFDLFNVTPSVTLNVMEKNQSLNGLISKIFAQMNEVFAVHEITRLIVQGDTSTAMSTAIAAFNNRISVYHVEAGLRSHDLSNPFPEEANRKLIGSIARLHFTPTKNASENLIQEGIEAEIVKEVGNTVIDALELVQKKITLSSKEYEAKFGKSLVENGSFVLITCHRRESFGKGINEISKAIKQLAESNPSIRFIYPVHLNPKVKEVVESKLKDISNVVLLQPLPYDELLFLLSRCRFVLTDSGGIQEEAPTFGKACVVMRATTERTEGIESGCAVLVGNQCEKIVSTTNHLLSSDQALQQMSPSSNPYGDGQASKRIVDIIINSN